MILVLEIAAVIKMEYSHGVHHHLLLGSMCVRVFERERERDQYTKEGEIDKSRSQKLKEQTREFYMAV